MDIGIGYGEKTQDDLHKKYNAISFNILHYKWHKIGRPPLNLHLSFEFSDSKTQQLVFRSNQGTEEELDQHEFVSPAEMMRSNH